MNSLVDKFRSEMKLVINHKTDAIGHGGASSFDDYKKKCGLVEGYEQSLQLFNDLYKNFVNEDED